MKKFLVLLLAALMVFSFAACGGGGGDEGAADDGAMKVAMVTDYGDITDQSFNQTTYEACKAFCEGNGIEICPLHFILLFCLYIIVSNLFVCPLNSMST